MRTIESYLDELHARLEPLIDGAVADYIPELGKADPAHFGIALATVDGHVYQTGDTQVPFSIQSISKAFAYGMALRDRGVETVRGKVGVEPSGEAFNSISLEPDTGRPLNPMINAGAIATTALIEGETPEQRERNILKGFANYIGHEVEIDQDIYASERDTGHRNRAIAHLLRNYDILEEDPEVPLDLYFRQCSILVTGRDLAVMGATLANRGVNPITGVRALNDEYVPRVLSVMSSCGMYDYSGAWIYDVGMPAKSGVGGGIVAVLPGQFGMAVFSPRLDPKGNSVRGIAVCEAISSDFGLHMLNATQYASATVIRANFSAGECGSKRERDPSAKDLLRRYGSEIRVLELAGELNFASAELVGREIDQLGDEPRYLVLDFARIRAMDQASTALLADVSRRLMREGVTVLYSGVTDRYALTRQWRRIGFKPAPSLYDNSDAALEWCENQLLAHHLGQEVTIPRRLEDFLICQSMDQDELTTLATLLEPVDFEPGAVICHEGERSDSLFFIDDGDVSVVLNRSRGTGNRVAAFTTGSVFGELALLQHSARTADVIADSKVACRRLPTEQLETGDPRMEALRLKLTNNLAHLLVEKLRSANEEIRRLGG